MLLANDNTDDVTNVVDVNDADNTNNAKANDDRLRKR
jgi:hypothetical protein